MVNLVGTERDDQWLAVPPVQLHWYGKEVRPARKVGHININHREPAVIHSALITLEDQLPADYGPVLTWLQQHLGQ
jgi:5-(carboxyamino)imidazole ribonucleotide synthase